MTITGKAGINYRPIVNEHIADFVERRFNEELTLIQYCPEPIYGCKISLFQLNNLLDMERQYYKLSELYDEVYYRERQIRDNNPTVAKAYEHYKTLLKLVEND